MAMRIEGGVARTRITAEVTAIKEIHTVQQTRAANLLKGSPRGADWSTAIFPGLLDGATKFVGVLEPADSVQRVTRDSRRGRALAQVRWDSDAPCAAVPVFHSPWRLTFQDECKTATVLGNELAALPSSCVYRFSTYTVGRSFGLERADNDKLLIRYSNR
jgi:hypothetical protein